MSVLNVARAECMEDEEIVIFEQSLAKFLDDGEVLGDGSREQDC